MKRRRNAPIAKRDKKALKRILRSHKGRGNSCRNPKRKRPSTGWSRAMVKRAIRADKQFKKAFGSRKRNPKRYSRQKRKSTKGRTLSKFKRALTRKLHHQGSGKHFQRSRRFSKWFTGAARSGQRVTRDAMVHDRSRRDLIKAWRALPRANPKRRLPSWVRDGNGNRPTDPQFELERVADGSTRRALIIGKFTQAHRYYKEWLAEERQYSASQDRRYPSRSGM